MKYLIVLVGLVIWVCLVLMKVLNFSENLVMLVSLDDCFVALLCLFGEESNMYELLV